MRVFIPRFLGALLYLVGLTLVGVVGYTLIEGWEVHDALYMSVITIRAVGYSEVLLLSQAGRDFTMVLLAAAITGIGVWFALITSFIVEFDLSDVRRRRRIMSSIEALNDHIVLCGGGRTGRQVMEELMSLGQDFVVIERDPKRVEWIHEQYPDILSVLGDATLDGNLTRAGIERARGLLTCLSADTENVFVCLSARHLKHDLTIVARVGRGRFGQALSSGCRPRGEPERQWCHSDGLHASPSRGGLVLGHRHSLRRVGAPLRAGCHPVRFEAGGPDPHGSADSPGNGSHRDRRQEADGRHPSVRVQPCGRHTPRPG